VSVEDQKWADIRIPALLDTPAAVRFLSCEPLLGPVSIAGAVDGTCWWCRGKGTLPGNNAPVQGFSAPNCWHCNGQGLDRRRIGWVIVGGESGSGARPMDPAWARTLRDQCEVTGTPFFFKQWGSHDEHGKRMSKHNAGRMLDGRTWDEYPDASPSLIAGAGA
jgi:protein gp37